MLTPFLERLARLCAIDSFTYDLPGVDACARLLAGWCAAAGIAVELVPSPVGLHLIASVTGRGGGRTILLGHHDTVFPAGIAAARPVTTRDGRALGPGVADMKGGLLVGLAALERLAADPDGPHGRVELHSVPDEEGRSEAPFVLDRFRGADRALCLECGRETGAIVGSRKAGTWLTLSARGRAAHAGTERYRGRSALAALAGEVLRIESQVHDARPGVSATATQFFSGDVKNTVPDRAAVSLDLRAPDAADLAWTVERIKEHGSYDGVTFALTDEPGFPAMERAPALVAATLAILADLGQIAVEENAGGVSDGSWTSAVGVPTVDGLGPIGALDHTDAEWIDLASVEPRCEAVVRLCRLPVDATR